MKELLTLKALRKLVPFSSTHVYHLVKRGEFPKPVRIVKLKTGP